MVQQEEESWPKLNEEGKLQDVNIDWNKCDSEDEGEELEFEDEFGDEYETDGGAGPPRTREMKSAEYFEAGVKAYQSKDLKGALRFFKRSLKGNPKIPDS